MAGPLRRRVAALAVVSAVAVPWAPTPAGAAPASSCTTTSGVVVAVDFTPWHGRVERGCGSTPTTGFDALHDAGFTTTPDQRDGPAFVCRINGYPTPDQDRCVNTPPGSAYWSYWHADPGQDQWHYESAGAASSHPQPGSVDAWVFGSGDSQGSSGAPRFSPASVRATRAGSPASPSPVTTRRAGSGRPASHPAAAPSRAPAATVTPSATPHHRARRSGRPHPADRAHPAAHHTVASAGGPTVPPAGTTVTSGAHPSPGTPTGLLVGLGLVVLLGTATAAAVRRRRRSP